MTHKLAMVAMQEGRNTTRPEEGRSRGWLWALTGYGVLLILLGGWVVWRTLGGAQPTQPVTSAGNPEVVTQRDLSRLIDEREYVIFFDEEEPLTGQRAVVAKFPQVEYIREGLFPGVVVVRILSDTEANLRALRQEPPVIMVQKSVPGMICH